jgi:hypothetical protein
MNFDVTNTKEWRPFFDRSFPRDVSHWPSVQVSCFVVFIGKEYLIVF